MSRKASTKDANQIQDVTEDAPRSARSNKLELKRLSSQLSQQFDMNFQQPPLAIPNTPRRKSSKALSEVTLKADATRRKSSKMLPQTPVDEIQSARGQQSSSQTLRRASSNTLAKLNDGDAEEPPSPARSKQLPPTPRRISGKTLNDEAAQSPPMSAHSVKSRGTFKMAQSSDALNWIPNDQVSVDVAKTPTVEVKPSKLRMLDYPKQLLKSGSSRNVRWWVGVYCCVLILLIAIIAMIIYFGLWVDMPDVNVLGVLSQQDGGRNKFALDLGSGGLRMPSVNISVTIATIITNMNHLDLTFDVIDIYTYNPVLPDLELSHTTIYDLFLAKDSQIPLNIPVTLQFSLGGENGKIPQDLVKSCTKKATEEKPEKQLQLNVKIYPRLKITSHIKINIPVIQNSPAFDCPFTADSNVVLFGQNISLLNIDWTQIAKGQFGYLPSA